MNFIWRGGLRPPSWKWAAGARPSVWLTLFLSATSAHAGDYWKDNNCVRSEPTPELAAELLKDHAFAIDREKGHAIETATVFGAPVAIVHSGCESLTWVITAPRQVGEEELELYVQAERILDMLPIDPTNGSFRFAAMTAIDRYRSLMEVPESGKLLIADPGEIRTTVQVEEAVEGGNTLVRITVSYGPL